MDILTHILSGAAAGTLAAGLSGSRRTGKLLIVGIGGIAGALPDLDVISLWSGFDDTLGRWFRLAHSGQEIYFGKLWYSHHAFMHSLAAPLFILALAVTSGWLFKAVFNQSDRSSWWKYTRKRQWLMVGFLSAYLIHLFEDMPTPSSVWGGVAFFWPSETYIGGTGDIWWWNNYDIFLIVAGVFTLNTCILLVSAIPKKTANRILIAVFLSGFSLAIYQVKTRGYDFGYSGHTTRYEEFEARSHQLQQEILGDKVYRLMHLFDRNLRISF